MKKLAIVILSAVAVLAVLSVTIIHLSKGGPLWLERPCRELVVLAHALSERNVKVVLIGDSLVQRSGMNSLCGSKALNAGVAGDRIADVIYRTPMVLALARPAKVVFEVGTNDGLAPKITDAGSFARSYASLVKMAQRGGRKVYLITVPPTAPGLEFSDKVDGARLEQFNASIRSLGRQTGATVIDVSRRLAGPSGRLAPLDTVDGVHLSARAYIRWRSVLTQSVCD